MKVTDFVFEDNQVIFDSFRAGTFYYNVCSKSPIEVYRFMVPLDDIGDATLECTDKAIFFMRWIRKGIEDNTIVKITK